MILTGLERDDSLPAGWSVRPLATGDLPAVRDLYALATAGSTGAARREPGGGVWSQLPQRP